MILNLNDRKLQMSALAGLAIYSAVVLKNGTEQMKMKDSPLGYVGKGLFTLGWLGLAYSFCGQPKPTLKCALSYGGALGVISAVMAMKTMKLSEQQKKTAGMIFVGSWIAVAIAVGLGKSMKSKQLGMFALANVLGSMLFILPKQRELCVVDGPGMGMFALTWVSLAIANAL